MNTFIDNTVPFAPILTSIGGFAAGVYYHANDLVVDTGIAPRDTKCVRVALVVSITLPICAVALIVGNLYLELTSSMATYAGIPLSYLSTTALYLLFCLFLQVASTTLVTTYVWRTKHTRAAEHAALIRACNSTRF